MYAKITVEGNDMFRRWTDYKSVGIQKEKSYEVVYKYTNNVIYKGRIEGDCFAGGTIEHVKSVSFDEIKPRSGVVRRPIVVKNGSCSTTRALIVSRFTKTNGFGGGVST